jgi:hypothetical protein
MADDKQSILAYYRDHRAQVDTAADPWALFLLDYFQTYGPTSIGRLSSDCGFGKDRTEDLLRILLDRGLIEKRKFRSRIALSKTGRRFVKDVLGEPQTHPKPAIANNGLNHYDRLLWAVCALGGGAVISATSSAASAAPQLTPFLTLRLTLPVLVMVFYAWRGYRAVSGDPPPLRMSRIGQLADSIYFLGFLWTLWALIDSFVIHQMSFADAVFRTFGYALVTTAAGMFLRMLLLQFQFPPGAEQEDFDESAAEVLGPAVELERLAGEVNNLSNTTHDAVRGLLHSLNETSKLLEMATDDAMRQTATVGHQLLDAQRINAEHAAKVIDTITAEFSRNMQSSLELLADANAQLAGEIGIVQRRVAESSWRLAKGFEESVRDFERGTESSLQRISAALQSSATQLEADLAAHRQVLGANLGRSTQSIETLTSAFSMKLAEASSDIDSGLATVAQQLRRIRIEPDIIERAVSKEVAALNSNLTSSTVALIAAVDQLKTVMSAMTEEVRSARSEPWWRRVFR